LIRKPPKERRTSPQTKNGIRCERAINKLPDIMTGMAKIKDLREVRRAMILATSLEVTAPANPVIMKTRPRVGTEMCNRSLSCGIRGAKTDKANESVKKDALSENIVFFSTAMSESY
jgi:hypothetical protein